MAQLTSTSVQRASVSAQAKVDQLVRKTTTGALFSADRKYRYLLWRTWADAGNVLLFVGLNPSTADENKNDPTIRRCIGFARSYGARGVIVSNLFAYRATIPRDLFVQADPIGPETDSWLLAASDFAEVTVACWGAHGSFRARSHAVLPLLKSPLCLGTTKHGQPKHPLYLKSSTELQSFRPQTGDA